MPAAYPYPLPSRNPLNGMPWELPERRLRLLLAHCGAAGEFGEEYRDVDRFVCEADHLLRYYREHVRAHLRRDPRQFDEIAEHAEALAHRLSKLEDLDGWPWRSLRVPQPADLQALAQAARIVSAAEVAMRGRGKRDPGPLLQRQMLINGLWDLCPEPLRSTALRGHFLESLRLVLGRAAGDAARRALQAEVKRARLAHEEHERLRREWSSPAK
jgi:hypothetical protein